MSDRAQTVAICHYTKRITDVSNVSVIIVEGMAEWLRLLDSMPKLQLYLAKASRFSAKPSPADSRWLSRRKNCKPSPAKRDPPVTV